jgi:hypothetical protein
MKAISNCGPKTSSPSRFYLRNFFQRRGAFNTPLPIDKNTNLMFKKVYCAIGNSFPKCSLGRCRSLHDLKQKLQLELSALFPIVFRIAKK